MRVGFFPTMAGRQAGGPETYEVSLLRALAEQPGDHTVDVFCLGEAARDSLASTSPRVTCHLLRPSSRWLSIPFSLPAAVRRLQPDLLHATLTAPPHLSAALAFTVHDLTMFENPEFYRPLTRLRLQHAIRPALKNAQLLLCISESVRQSVQARFHTPPERLAVIHHGVSPRFMPVPNARQIVADTLRLDRPFLLFIGQMKLRKNIVRLLQAFAQVRAAGCDIDLVLAGRRGETSEGMDAVMQQHSLRPYVHELGHVPDSLLPALYSAAQAFLFPSLHEGFGLPVLEAMACGTPVLTSTAAALPEIAGDAALLVDPTRTEAIADATLRLLSDSGLRQRLIANGTARAAEFSWSRCARQTLQAYRQVLA